MNHRLEFKAMGSHMVAIVESPASRAPALLEQVPLWFEAWEQCLSRFRPQSELNQLNRAAGWPVPVSETLWQVLQAALRAERISDGLVTPLVLEALLAAGYDRSFERLPAERETPATAGWPRAGSLDEIQLDPASRSVCLPLDMQLDFGGVAKGWAAQQAAQRLAGLGPALVSAGGDIAISAAPSAGERWPVGVDDPFEAGAQLETLLLARCGVATSGTDYRRWKLGGRWSHHIIDPRSGRPAQTDVLSATVIAPDVLQAEACAKAVLISGSRDGLQWLETRPQLAGLLVLENGERLYSRRMQQFLWRQS